MFDTRRSMTKVTHVRHEVVTLRVPTLYPRNVWNGAVGAYWLEVNQWDVEGMLVSRFSRSCVAVSVGTLCTWPVK